MTSLSIGRLLIVDDEVKLMTTLCETLSEQGYETVGCASGQEALAALHAQPFDILLTDLMMPDTDGIALLRAGLEIDPDLIGILMTGQGTVQTAVEAMKVGAFDYITKPFKLNAILPVLTRAMEVRRLRSENVQLRETLAIYELSKAIAFTLDLHMILYKMADAVIQQCAADEVSIMLPTQDGRDLFVAVVRGKEREHLLGERVPLDQGIAGWVACHREPLTLHGEVTDPRFTPVVPRSDIRSAVVIPMVAGGAFVGVVNVNTTRQRSFTLGQIKALSVLTGMAAAAVENARLYRQVQEAEAKYRSIFEHAVEGIFQSTPEGRFLTVNPALARMLGYESPDDLITGITDIGRQLYGDPQRRVEWIRLVQEQGIVSQFEAQMYRKDGRAIWVSENARAVRDANGTLLHYEGTIEDITERKRAEEEFKKLQAQFLQAQKMESVGRLAGGVAHDFNNLLTIINGYSSLLLTTLDTTDPKRADVEEIKTASDRAAALTRQLLIFSRRQTLEPRILNLNDLLTTLDKMLHRLIGEDIDLITIPAQDLWLVRADPGQIEQVLMNLVVNARDAMPHGGQLTIETENVELDDAYAQTHFEVTPGAYVMLAVSDTGIGMSPAVQAQIFEPFFTTKEQGKGTGLGLSTVYGIVKQSGGHIWVYSEEGKGTTFKVYLPRVEEAKDTPTQPGESKRSSGGTETILLVEDNDMVRKLSVRTLTELGYTVIEAQNPQEALGLCEQVSSPIHLLLTDVIMPGMTGKDLADRVQTLRPGVKVLYMSGYTDDAILHSGILEAKVSFLSKPFSPEVLASKVRAVLDN
jgi:PAS domain S-box-containing protein